MPVHKNDTIWHKNTDGTKKEEKTEHENDTSDHSARLFVKYGDDTFVDDEGDSLFKHHLPHSLCNSLF